MSDDPHSHSHSHDHEPHSHAAPQARWKEDGVRVIKGDRLDPNTAQTPGMFRQAAINQARVGAQKIWAGTVAITGRGKREGRVIRFQRHLLLTKPSSPLLPARGEKEFCLCRT